MGLFSKKEQDKYIHEIHTENDEDVDVLLTLEEKIQREEQNIKSRLPEAYRNFLLETPFTGIDYYPKAAEKDNVFGAFYVPEGSWTETEDGQIGRLKISLYGAEDFYAMAEFNNGVWTMPCIHIGTLNEDRLIVLNCETGKIYCTEHDEVWFDFNSREDYDKKMQAIAQDVFFPDFEGFLAWCKGDDVYIPKST